MKHTCSKELNMESFLYQALCGRRTADGQLVFLDDEVACPDCKCLMRMRESSDGEEIEIAFRQILAERFGSEHKGSPLDMNLYSNDELTEDLREALINRERIADTNDTEPEQSGN